MALKGDVENGGCRKLKHMQNREIKRKEERERWREFQKKRKKRGEEEERNSPCDHKSSIIKRENPGLSVRN